MISLTVIIIIIVIISFLFVFTNNYKKNKKDAVQKSIKTPIIIGIIAWLIMRIINDSNTQNQKIFEKPDKTQIFDDFVAKTNINKVYTDYFY